MPIRLFPESGGQIDGTSDFSSWIFFTGRIGSLPDPARFGTPPNGGGDIPTVSSILPVLYSVERKFSIHSCNALDFDLSSPKILLTIANECIWFILILFCLILSHKWLRYKICIFTIGLFSKKMESLIPLNTLIYHPSVSCFNTFFSILVNLFNDSLLGFV